MANQISVSRRTFVGGVATAIGAIGVGIPSRIDQRDGRAVASVNVPLTDVDLREHLHTRFGVPAAIENDANAAAWAETRFGAGHGLPRGERTGKWNW